MGKSLAEEVLSKEFEEIGSGHSSQVVSFPGKQTAGDKIRAELVKFCTQPSPKDVGSETNDLIARDVAAKLKTTNENLEKLNLTVFNIRSSLERERPAMEQRLREIERAVIELHRRSLGEAKARARSFFLLFFLITLLYLGTFDWAGDRIRDLYERFTNPVESTRVPASPPSFKRNSEQYGSSERDQANTAITRFPRKRGTHSPHKTSP